jgi:hypothetical protein
VALQDLFPQKQDRLKVFGIVAIIVVCGGWLAYYANTHIEIQKTAKMPDSPGLKAGRELNEKLASDHAFLDVGVVVVSESPLKFLVNGAVWSNADLERLPAALKELNPNAEFDIQTQVMRK